MVPNTGRFLLRLIPGALLVFLLLVTGVLGNDTPGALATSNEDGTGTPPGTTMGTPVPLTQTFSTELKGDYVAAGVGMRGTGPSGSGTVTLPALPSGSTVENAFLYWAVMNNGITPALAAGNINGNPITGTLIGTTADPCWPVVTEIHNYVADVTSYVLPGANALTGFASGSTEFEPPILDGASLVVVYSNPASSDRTVIIHEGAISFMQEPPESTTFTGFSAEAGTSETTFIVADGQDGLNNRTLVDGTETANHVLNGAGPGTEYWDTLTQDISAFIPAGDTNVTTEVESAGNGTYDCLTWVAQVVSVPAPPTVTGLVGGIVDINVDSPASLVASAEEGSAGSWVPYWAGVAAATVLALTAGAWYARRRWLR
jgi:hypothetical protein